MWYLKLLPLLKVVGMYLISKVVQKVEKESAHKIGAAKKKDAIAILRAKYLSQPVLEKMGINLSGKFVDATIAYIGVCIDEAVTHLKKKNKLPKKRLN